MESPIAENFAERVYQVVIVERVEPTEDRPGKWCRYVVQRGESKIEGFHMGETDEVTRHAESFVETLNERITKKIYAYGRNKKNDNVK